MSTTTQQSTTATQAARSRARAKPTVEGIRAEDVIAAAKKNDKRQGNNPSDTGSVEPSTANPATTPALPTDPEKLKSVFNGDVETIKGYGTSFPTRVKAFASATVLEDLGQIMGVLRKYFVGASTQQIDLLKEELWKQVDMKRNFKTTECHLLSRIYRGSDRRKASADAKVLKEALDNKVTQQDFAAWVKKEGGYDAIVKRNSQANKAAAGSGGPKKINPKKLWENTGKAVSALVKNGQYREVFTFDKSEWPDLYEKVCPTDRGYSRLVIVNSTGDDVHFHILESFCPYSPGYAHKHPVNVDGTSTNTWPEWMLAKPDDGMNDDTDSDATE